MIIENIKHTRSHRRFTEKSILSFLSSLWVLIPTTTSIGMNQQGEEDDETVFKAHAATWGFSACPEAEKLAGILRGRVVFGIHAMHVIAEFVDSTGCNISLFNGSNIADMVPGSDRKQTFASIGR